MNLPKTSSTSGFHFNTMYSKNQSTKNMKWFILHGAQFYPSTTILLSYHYFILLPLYHFPTTISPSYHYFTLLPQFFLNLNSYLIPIFSSSYQFYHFTTILPFYHYFTLQSHGYENVANLSVLAIQTNTLQLMEQDVCQVQAVCCVVNRHCSDMPHIVSHKFYPPPAIEICSPNHTGLTSIRPVEMSVIQSQLS